MMAKIIGSNDKIPWYLYDDNIYRITFPVELTMNYIIEIIISIIHDYTNRFGEDKKIRVLIDASKALKCSEAIMLTVNHSAREQQNSKIAIWNRTLEYKNLEDKYYEKHNHTPNIMSFDSEKEAIDWLKI